jgi:hypothetical protein
MILAAMQVLNGCPKNNSYFPANFRNFFEYFCGFAVKYLFSWAEILIFDVILL